MLELKAKTYGDEDAEPIVLMHGLFGASANWGSIARQLAGHYRVIVPDLRNHGDSPHAADCSFAALAADVSGLLDRFGLSSPTLVGHSMGGKVAMHLALTVPERVARLVVVDIAPVAYAHDFENVLSAFRAVDLATIGSRADADAQMRAAMPMGGVRAFLLQNLVRRDGAWGWRVNLDALAAAQSQVTGFPDYPASTAYGGPTCFIYGDRSDYVKPSYHPVMQGLFPNMSRCQVDGAGHWVYADQPQGFMRCLGDFLGIADAAD